LRGKLALTFDRAGKRHRYSLGTSDPNKAYALAPAMYAELTRSITYKTVGELWRAYCQEKSDLAIMQTMVYTWRALEARFSARNPESITTEDCRAHIEYRRNCGIHDGTIHTELGHLSTVLNWAQKRQFINKAPFIERPSKPRPRERYLTYDEVLRLVSAAKFSHIRLAIHLMVGTAARVSALLQLTWDRVDFQKRLIFLRDPDDVTRRKGRAIVPINNTLLSALQDARAGAMSPYVIE